MNSQPAISREHLAAYLENYLQVARISDYCPNGLQVEGKREIRRVITGVTASMQLIEHAVATHADAVLVHHGLFWKGDPPVLNGFRRQRLAKVLAHDLNVFAYHLPLDIHPEVGNNVQLAAQMGWVLHNTVGDKGLVCIGAPAKASTVQTLVNDLSQRLGRVPEVVGTLDQAINTIVWCTGGAASYVELAASHGADVFVTGELSESAVHIALETGTVLIGAGHHATERGGPQALGEHLAAQFGIDVEFIDCYVNV
jgi:dinuclear metal center YbgI/SA1388 family protein